MNQLITRSGISMDLVLYLTVAVCVRKKNSTGPPQPQGNKNEELAGKRTRAPIPFPPAGPRIERMHAPILPRLLQAKQLGWSASRGALNLHLLWG
jgi:hypothetical protein